VATPRAKKLAKQLGVALESLRGSGPHGRIQAEDVERAQRPAAERAPGIGRQQFLRTCHRCAGRQRSLRRRAAGAAPLGQAFGSPGETVAFNTLQQAVIRNMAASLTVPCFHVGYTITTDRFDCPSTSR